MARIVLLGDSVVLSCIGAGLARGGWDVARLEAGEPDAASQIHGLSPRAVLFEIGRASPGCILDLLTGDPGLPVIGIDPVKHRMSALCGHEKRVETMIDLVQLLAESGSELFGDTADQVISRGGTS